MDKHSATFFRRSLYTFADSENMLHVYYITDQELKLRDGKTVSGVLCFFCFFFFLLRKVGEAPFTPRELIQRIGPFLLNILGLFY